MSKLSKLRIAASSISSARTKSENKATLALLLSQPPQLQLLFLSPETACNGQMLSKLSALSQRGELILLAVDEAHCICQAPAALW